MNAVNPTVVDVGMGMGRMRFGKRERNPLADAITTKTPLKKMPGQVSL